MFFLDIVLFRENCHDEVDLISLDEKLLDALLLPRNGRDGSAGRGLDANLLAQFGRIHAVRFEIRHQRHFLVTGPSLDVERYRRKAALE